MAYVKNINGYDIKDAEARDQIAALKEYVDRPLGRWIFVGDSYNLNDRTDGSGAGWGKRIIDNLGLTESYSFAIGGTAFGKSGNLNFRYVLSENINSVSDPDTITDILVGGGYNDWEQTTANIDAGIISFIEYAKTVCQNARVHIAFIGRSTLYDRNAQFPRVFRRYQHVSGLHGASYVANSEAVIRTTHLLESDGIHPTSAGLAQIASCLGSYVVYGNCSYYSGLVTGRLTPAGAFTFNTNSRLYSTCHNSLVSTLLYNLRLTVTGSNITISGSDYTDIATIDRCTIMGDDGDFYTFKCFVYVKSSATGSFTTGLMSFKIYRGSNNILRLAARSLPFGTFSGWQDMDVWELYTYKDPVMNTYPALFGDS